MTRLPDNIEKAIEEIGCAHCEAIVRLAAEDCAGLDPETGKSDGTGRLSSGEHLRRAIRSRYGLDEPCGECGGKESADD